MDWTYGEAELMALMYLSASAGGGLNLSQVNDPDLNVLLSATRTSTDAAKRQDAVNQAQKRIVEQAYVVPLYAPIRFRTLANSVKAAVWSQAANQLYLNDAYIEAK
jgi:peptide/nickel transport system substrate-binding protein